jgi:hypothetical protein
MIACRTNKRYVSSIKVDVRWHYITISIRLVALYHYFYKTRVHMKLLVSCGGQLVSDDIAINIHFLPVGGDEVM